MAKGYSVDIGSGIWRDLEVTEFGSVGLGFDLREQLVRENRRVSVENLQ